MKSDRRCGGWRWNCSDPKPVLRWARCKIKIGGWDAAGYRSAFFYCFGSRKFGYRRTQSESWSVLWTFDDQTLILWIFNPLGFSFHDLVLCKRGLDPLLRQFTNGFQSQRWNFASREKIEDIQNFPFGSLTPQSSQNNTFKNPFAEREHMCLRKVWQRHFVISYLDQQRGGDERGEAGHAYSFTLSLGTYIYTNTNTKTNTNTNVNTFLGQTGPGLTPGWGIKVSNTSFPLGVCLDSLSSFQINIFLIFAHLCLPVLVLV